MPQRGGTPLDQRFKFFVCGSQLSFALPEGFLRPLAFSDALAQCFLRPFAFSDIVEAVDRSRDFALVVCHWSNIHDDDNPRTIGPLNVHFRIMRPRYPA